MPLPFRAINFLILVLSIVSSAAGTWSDSFSGSSLSPDWRGNTNAFWIDSGVLHGTSADPIRISPLNFVEVGTNWSNYVVTCSINVVSPNTHRCTKGAIILNHFGDEGYVFALHEATQTIELYRLSNHEMLLSKPAAIHQEQWYRVRAEVQNNSLALWVDDIFIGTVTGTVSSAGSVGLAVQDADEVLFENFSVTGPDIPDHANTSTPTWSDTFSGTVLGPDWHGSTTEFFVRDGLLHGSSVSPLDPAPFNLIEIGNNWSNYVVSCSINIIQPNTAVCTKGALVLRHSGNEGYVFALHEATQTIELYRLSNHEMLLSKPAVINLKRFYRVRAELQGDSLSFWVDDAFIGTVTDSRSPGGSVGLAVQDADEVQFDDFSVTGANIPENGTGSFSAWSDDFSGNILRPEWHGDTNDFSITNGYLQGLSISGALSVGPLNTLEIDNARSNYTVTCAINIIRPLRRICSKGALILRHSGSEGYVFALHEPTQTFEFYRLSNHEMLLSKPASIVFTNWYRVRAEVQGNTFSLWVNNAFIGMVTDSRVSTGSVGVAVQDAETWFDDFTITPLTGNEPPHFELHSSAASDGKLQFGLTEGAMIYSGQWYLEVTHDFESWERLSSFSPGNVSAFAQTTPPADDPRPRFYRAILIQ